MDAKLIAESDAVRRTAERLERVGLVVDRAGLSRQHRRAFYAVQCLVTEGVQRPAPRHAPIGFAYPNAR
jgi:hypothetical protein